MGFLDALLGKRKLKQPAAADRLFALTTAYVTLDSSGIATRGEAAIVFQPLATADFERIVKDIEESCRAPARRRARRHLEDDNYGYRWMILRDPDVDDLVVGSTRSPTLDQRRLRRPHPGRGVRLRGRRATARST